MHFDLFCVALISVSYSSCMPIIGHLPEVPLKRGF